MIEALLRRITPVRSLGLSVCHAGARRAARRAASWRFVSRGRLSPSELFIPPAELHEPPSHLLAASAQPCRATPVVCFPFSLAHSPQSGGEGRFHAAERPPTRLAGARRGSRGAARLRRFRLARQHAVADDGGGEG